MLWGRNCDKSTHTANKQLQYVHFIKQSWPCTLHVAYDRGLYIFSCGSNKEHSPRSILDSTSPTLGIGAQVICGQQRHPLTSPHPPQARQGSPLAPGILNTQRGLLFLADLRTRFPAHHSHWKQMCRIKHEWCFLRPLSELAGEEWILTGWTWSVYRNLGSWWKLCAWGGICWTANLNWACPGGPVRRWHSSRPAGGGQSGGRLHHSRDHNTPRKDELEEHPDPCHPGEC